MKHSFCHLIAAFRYDIVLPFSALCQHNPQVFSAFDMHENSVTMESRCRVVVITPPFLRSIVAELANDNKSTQKNKTIIIKTQMIYWGLFFRHPCDQCYAARRGCGPGGCPKCYNRNVQSPERGIK